MRLVKPKFEIFEIMSYHPEWSPTRPLKLIELAGRTCYKSEEKITTDSCKKFVQKLNKLGHHSVIEHSAMTIWFQIDRGVSHELVRHRLASYSQESTRYCNYRGGVTFVIPPWVYVEEGDYTTLDDFDTGQQGAIWLLSMLKAENSYLQLLGIGWSPQQARSVLPNSLKTEIVVTANFRQWQHILKLRTHKTAHPQMREIMRPLLDELKTLIPVIFDEINY